MADPKPAGPPYDETISGLTIDIMMPFYGDPALLRVAVESVRDQTSDDWRLVVIDDRYPDPEPGAWVRQLDDPRIVYTLNERNLGVAGNFSRAVDLVEQSHFVLMGCDDELEPTYVEDLSAAIARFPEASYFQPDVTAIDASGSVVLPLADRVKRWYRPRVSEATELKGQLLATSLIRGNWTYFPSICWRTSEVRKHGFSADFEVVLDLALQLDIVIGGGTLVVLPDLEFHYRRHEASVSSWTARDSSRFDEERAFFLSSANRLRAIGWSRASGAAARHWSSRLNAATRLPGALRARDRSGARGLTRHIFLGWNA